LRRYGPIPAYFDKTKVCSALKTDKHNLNATYETDTAPATAKYSVAPPKIVLTLSAILTLSKVKVSKERIKDIPRTHSGQKGFRSNIYIDFLDPTLELSFLAKEIIFLEG
jgi:hypothetical protein